MTTLPGAEPGATAAKLETTETTESIERIETLVERIREGTDGVLVPERLLEGETPSESPPAPPSGSFLAQIREMTVPARLKLAMKGNHEARTILLRDSNRLIRKMVLVNPKITEEEIVVVCKDRNADADLLRGIGENRDWMESYPIRYALAENPRSPVATSLRLLKSLQERDLRSIAKSRNVPTAVSGTARRMLFEKQQASSLRR